jgi:hypothetical protein
MQESYRDGSQRLIDAKAVTPEIVKQAQDNPDVESYSFHKPGSTLQARDGRKYEVRPDGSWKVLNKPRSRVKRLRDERRAANR